MSNQSDKKRKTIFLIIIAGVILFAAAFSLRSLTVHNRETSGDGKHLKGYNSKSIYVYNLTDDKVQVDINGDERLPVASLTKLMTCRKALEIMRAKSIRLSDQCSVTSSA